ncbi:MAG: hypothetical protein AAGI13_15175 [Pseudomonadota bacterium]
MLRLLYRPDRTPLALGTGLAFDRIMVKASSAIDGIDLSLPITSEEGLDVNHASRARIQFLAAQSHALLTQTQFADAKAAALMTVSGLMILHGPAKGVVLADASLALLASLACLAACLAGCFLAIVPRYPKAAARRETYAEDRYSWPGLADPSHADTDFPDFMRQAEASHLVLSMARANQAAARVLQRKFSVLRATFFLGFAGIALIGLDAALHLFGA